MSGTDPDPGMADEGRRSFLERLGVVGDDEGRLILEVGPGHLRSLGIVHGGVVATLLDSVMGHDAGRRAPADHYVVTAQLNVNFIRPAFPEERLVASSEIRHSGRMTAVAQGEIRTGSGALVATGSATFCYVAHSHESRKQVERLDPGPNPARDEPA